MAAVLPTTPKSKLSGIQDALLNGMELSGVPGWALLSLVTLCPGIGQLGLNHVLIGQPVVAVLKAISLPISYLLIVYLSPYLPLILQGKWLFYLAALGPWYLFDCLQVVVGYYTGYISMIDVDFIPLSPQSEQVMSGGANELSTVNPILEAGSVVPSLTTPNGTVPGAREGRWKLTASKANIVFGGLAVSMQLIPFIFGESQRTNANIASGVFAGLLSLLGIASSFSAVTTPITALMGGFSNPVPVAPLTGGGSELPPLSHFLKDLRPQNGGATTKEKKESTFFLQGLGFIVLAGLTLGLIRSKQ
jgi:hypothetical protein